MDHQHDLFVPKVSSSLSSFNIDLVVSGSIAAVESTRFVRSLRRLGANVTVYLTKGGSQFTTETALGWASTNPVRTKFTDSAEHLAAGDAVIVAPASSSFISKIAHAHTGEPATALVASYLGLKKPVLMLPAMHGSLANNPFFQENLQRVSNKCTILEAREEEGKKEVSRP